MLYNPTIVCFKWQKLTDFSRAHLHKRPIKYDNFEKNHLKATVYLISSRLHFVIHLLDFLQSDLRPQLVITYINNRFV